MAVTNEYIQNWFRANPNVTGAEAYRFMQDNMVGQDQFASALNFNPAEVQSAYLREQAAATPVVKPPVVTAPVVTAPVVTAPVVTAPVVTQAPETEAQWRARMPTTGGLTAWQKQRPGYVDPMDYNTYEQYIAAANPNYRMGTDAGTDLQNQANFYGLTIENYLNALKGNEGGLSGNLSGSQLLSPLQRIAAETARGQGFSTMSPETAALAKKYPDVFNEASRNWSNYLKTTYPGTLEYESALAGPMQFGATGVTMPQTSSANSMYFLDPTTKQITRNPNYKPTPLAAAPVQIGTTPTAPGLIGTRPVGVRDTTAPVTPGGTTGLFGAPVVNGTTQGLLGQINNLPLGSYAGSYAPIQKSYENYMAIPAGAQFNPAITTGGKSPAQFIQSNWTGLKNVYEGQLPYTSMGGYNPALYSDLAKENKRMADITAAQAIRQQLDVLNQGGGDGGGDGGDGGDGGGGGGGGCVDPAVLITLADGTYAPAGSIKVGDVLFTMHEKTQEFGAYPVEYVEELDQPKALVLFDDGSNMLVSHSHKFFMVDGEWKQVYQLEPGDTIKAAPGATDKKVVKLEPKGNGPVMKFTVKDAHTYISEGLISHNSKAKGGLITSVFGPNPPGPDDGAVNLDLGEYVIKKSSVDKYGRGLLDMINEGKVPAKKMKSLLG